MPHTHCLFVCHLVIISKAMLASCMVDVKSFIYLSALTKYLSLHVCVIQCTCGPLNLVIMIIFMSQTIPLNVSYVETKFLILFFSIPTYSIYFNYIYICIHCSPSIFVLNLKYLTSSTTNMTF